MKKIIIAVFLTVLANQSFAENYTLGFGIQGGIIAGNTTWEKLALDVSSTRSSFITAAGVIGTDYFASPATGTCFATDNGGAYCNLQVDQYSINLELDGNLNGTISVKNALGNNFATKSIMLTLIK